jgi:CBS domain-containing protein
MARQVITASADTSLNEIASLMEKNTIKRVPIVTAGQLVGIVTRANLMQAVASAPKGLEIQPSDTAIRDRLLVHLKAQPWAETRLLNVTVSDGIVDLWGITNSETQRKAICVAAESTPGVRAVRDNMMMRPKSVLVVEVSPHTSAGSLGRRWK